MSDWLNTSVFSVMEKGLAASNLRQRVLSNNVANMETPGFKRSDVDFQQALDTALGNQHNLALKLTSPRHIAGATNRVEQDIVTDPSSIQSNGNNVDIDREMTDVAENDLYYGALSQAESRQLGILRLVISQNPTGS